MSMSKCTLCSVVIPEKKIKGDGGQLFCSWGCYSVWKRARLWTLSHEDAKALLDGDVA